MANFLTALAASFIFKVALFAYSTSGAEGVESAILTWPRLALCFGWDVLSACVVAAAAAAVAVPLGRRLPRVALAWSLLVQTAYGLFLLISFNVAIIVGAPLDKAAIDLMFFYNATPGGTSRLMADSIAPYVTPTFGVEAVACLALPPLILFWIRRSAGAASRARPAQPRCARRVRVSHPGGCARPGQRPAGGPYVRPRAEPADDAGAVVRARAAARPRSRRSAVR